MGPVEEGQKQEEDVTKFPKMLRDSQKNLPTSGVFLRQANFACKLLTHRSNNLHSVRNSLLSSVVVVVASQAAAAPLHVC